MIFFIIFISILIGVVIRSTQVPRDLVRDDYYALDINYQDRFDRIENGQNLERELQMRYSGKEKCLWIDFGSSIIPIQAKIRMYRVAGSKSEDLNYELTVEENKETCVPLEGLISGRWKVEINWEDTQSKFYKEDRILIP